MGRRILIIGGVGAGASAATRARRLDENAVRRRGLRLV